MARILVVDDDAANRELVVTLLELCGHEIAEAVDGADALEQVRKFKPDVVVCDILMPRMDGFEFVRIMRSESAIAQTQVVFYTATFLEIEARALAAECGVHRVLTKPCEPDDMVAAIDDALGHAGSRHPTTSGTLDFASLHLRLVTDKLAEKAKQQELANQQLAALINLNMQLTSEPRSAVRLQMFCSSAQTLFEARAALLLVREDLDTTAKQLFASGLDPEEFESVRGIQNDAELGTTQLLPCRYGPASGDDGLRTSVRQWMPDACSALVVPVLSSHKRYGWMMLVDKQHDQSFSADEERTLAMQATQLAALHENGRLYSRVLNQVDLLQAQAEQRDRETKLLRLEHDIARVLGATDAIEDGVRTVLQAVCETQRWEVGRFWQVDHDADLLRSAVQWCAPTLALDDHIAEELVQKSGDGLVSRVWRTGEPMWIPDLSREPRALLTIGREHRLDSAILFPLAHGTRVFGVILFVGHEIRRPDERLLSSARVIGNQLGQFIERTRAQDAVKASERFLIETLDSLQESVCVIDSGGFILKVNRAWTEFALSEGGDSRQVMTGANYLHVCGNAQGDGSADAQAMAKGILDVIDGRVVSFAMEYPCDSPSAPRWFVARATRFSGEGPVRVVVAHHNITERKLAELRISRLHRAATVLSEINALIVRASSRDELFREICDIAVITGHFRMAWIGILHRDPLRAQIFGGARSGPHTDYCDILGAAVHHHAGGATPQYQQLVHAQKPVVVNDLAACSWMTTRDAALKEGARSAVVLPLVIESVTCGIFMLYADRVGFFDDEELKLLGELADDLAFAMEHLEQAEKLYRLAFYDPLTNHANRTLFNERVARHILTAADESTCIAVGVVDIERFKYINDVWGRHVGDEVLRQLANRLLVALADRNHMARVGPDQFGMIIERPPQGLELSRTLHEIYSSCFGAEFLIGSAAIHVAARMGFALYPRDGKDAETLFRNAETAAKRTKHASDRVLLYNNVMSEAVAEKIMLESRLREALKLDRFVLHYQPKVDARTRDIVGVEALMRWLDPELGLVPPFQFIPLMEETGLIVEVGSWALRQAVRDREGWIENGLAAPKVAVNVSLVQLRRTDFVEIVLGALGHQGGAAGIELEITESAAMEDVEETIVKLRRLNEHGITLSIDDFGTGYSSLAYLSKLPVQVLKIDRAFTMSMNEDPDTMTLMMTMISLAHAMRMKVVAEGVETEAQAANLRRLDCDQLQGYLISRPLPEREFSRQLKPRTPSHAPGSADTSEPRP